MTVHLVYVVVVHSLSLSLSQKMLNYVSLKHGFASGFVILATDVAIFFLHSEHLELSSLGVMEQKKRKPERKEKRDKQQE